MPRNTTDPMPEALSPAQALALTALLAGATVTAAAERAGVGRETVHRWLRDDPAFVAGLNAGKADIVTAARAELRGLAAEAVARLRTLIQNPDPEPHALPIQFKAIMEVLRMTGAADREPIGPTDPADAATAIKVATSQRKLDELMARLGDS